MADMPRPDPSQTASASIAEREFVLLLISLYRDCPELWKVKTKEYLNKNKRSLAIKKILKVLKIYKPEYNEETFKRKINTLRTNFNKECQKINQKKKSGVPTAPSLWYFNELMFIKDQVKIADTESSERSLIKDSSRQSATAAPYISTKEKIQCASAGTDDHVGLATSYFKRPKNESDVLAMGWAMKLSRLPPDQRRYAEKIINDTLFEAEMGTLTRNGVCFMSSADGTNSVKQSCHQYI